MWLLIAASLIAQQRTPGYGLDPQIYTINVWTVDQVRTGRVFLKVRDYYLIEKGKGVARWKPYDPRMKYQKGDKVRLASGEWLP